MGVPDVVAAGPLPALVTARTSTLYETASSPDTLMARGTSPPVTSIQASAAAKNALLDAVLELAGGCRTIPPVRNA